MSNECSRHLAELYGRNSEFSLFAKILLTFSVVPMIVLCYAVGWIMTKRKER